ncbi:MAG: antibiotic biosynthesis monooxygenase [Bacteroidota bacterium]
MAIMIVRHRAVDMAAWKQIFDDTSHKRRNAGCSKDEIFVSQSDANEVAVFTHWESISQAKNFSQSTELKEDMMKAGIVGPPTIYFID